MNFFKPLFPRFHNDFMFLHFITLCTKFFWSIFYTRSRPLLLIVFIFFSSVLHLSTNRSNHQIRLLSLPFAERANRAFLRRRSPAWRYKERIVIVVRPETLVFCFISWKRKRLLHRFQEKTKSNQALSPKDASLWGAQRKNDSQHPKASNFKGAQFRTLFA